MNFKKNDIIALIGSIIFHLAIFLLLFFTVLKTIVPEDDGGILVNFGNIDAAAGLFEPQGENASSDEEAAALPQETAPTPPEEMITQDMEETVSLTDKKKEEERKKKEEAKKKEDARKKEADRKAEAERKKKEEQQKREQAINNRVAGAFGSANGEQGNQGNADNGSGNQGSPFGNSNTGANEGVGGVGSFNLNGRSIGSGGLPRPAYTIQEEGRIVINITVDPKGNVIMAEIGKGTNIDNATMRKSAIEAAKRAKFNSIQGTNNQSGTITYRYSLK